MALLCGLSMPKLSTAMGAWELKADAGRMASLLRLARQEAITSGQPRTVIFYPANAKYKINGETSINLEPGNSFIGTTTFTQKVGGLPACGFSPSGAPSSGGTVTLGNGSGRIYIIVNPVAGRIRISESPPQDW